MKTTMERPAVLVGIEQAILAVSKAKVICKQNAQVIGLTGILVAAMEADTSLLKAGVIGLVSYLLIRWGKRS